MFPIALNLSMLPLLLVGEGPAFDKRRKQLEEAGASQLTLVSQAEVSDAQLAASRMVMVAGMDRARSEAIAKRARAIGRLVNVEDVNDLCDFYFTSHVRRGDLIVAVSTGGASPTLAKRLRAKIGEWLGEEWEGRTQEIAAARQQWKTDGKSMKEVEQLTDRLLAERGWL
jgi:precorrin-2 dehydrogenase/sirohydrochlorin ferrochelatase